MLPILVSSWHSKGAISRRSEQESSVSDIAMFARARLEATLRFGRRWLNVTSSGPVVEAASSGTMGSKTLYRTNSTLERTVFDPSVQFYSCSRSLMAALIVSGRFSAATEEESAMRPVWSNASSSASRTVIGLSACTLAMFSRTSPLIRYICSTVIVGHGESQK